MSALESLVKSIMSNHGIYEYTTTARTSSLDVFTPYGKLVVSEQDSIIDICWRLARLMELT